MPSTSIVIPVHNKAALTRQCLHTLMEQAHENTEIIVVDDASTDATVSLLPRYGTRIRAIRQPFNDGFASACNAGARVASGEHLVFLNNDTIPQPGWLDALLRYAERHPHAAVIGSKLLYPNDTIQHAGVIVTRERRPEHLYRAFPAQHPAVNVSRRFQIVTAACVLVRRPIFAELGGFDTVFVNGFEDVDFCLRCGERGHEVHYCHESVLYHLESLSREGQNETNARNERIFHTRWHERLQPDDLSYYLADGLIKVGYAHGGARISVSPLLDGTAGDERERLALQLLSTRSHQVASLLRDNIRLRARFQELERTESPDFSPAATTLSSTSESPQSVSIVLPVHNASVELSETLASVRRHTNLTQHQLVVVDDASTDGRVRRVLARLVDEVPGTLLLNNRHNLGYSATVNRGMQATERDVVLLNSDVIVTRGWLEKLQAAAYARPEIASATPFSNNATICSIPRFLEVNTIPAGFTIDSFAELVERVSLRTYPQIPSGVGFCWYLRRDAVQRVGVLDAERFASGYGVENEWCFRALQTGFTHVLDDATYVFHHGGRSLIRQSDTRSHEEHLRAVQDVHPGYLALIEGFYAQNPLRPLHELIDAATRVALGPGAASPWTSWGPEPAEARPRTNRR